jgi:ABC-type amino acid transport system permease subunit
MPNYEQPQNELKIEQAEIDRETFREIVTNIFFKSAYPKTTQELLSRIQEQSSAFSISAAELEQKLMDEIGDQMANSVD